MHRRDTYKPNVKFSTKLGKQFTYERLTEARSLYYCCRGKTLSFTFSERLFVAVVTQHAMRMRSIILSSVASQTIPYFSPLFKNGTFSRYRPSVAQRVGRGIALLFHDRGTRRG